MSNSLENKYILFPDKISRSNISDINDEYLTANNVNEIKDAVNSSISKIIEMEHFLTGSVNPRFNALSSTIDELNTNPKFKQELEDTDTYLSSVLTDVLSTNIRLSGNIYDAFKKIGEHSIKLEYHDTEIEQYVSGLHRSLSIFELELNNIKTKLSNLGYSSENLLSSNTRFENIINDVKKSDLNQNLSIKSNTNDLKEIKTKLENQAELLNNISKTQNVDLNNIILENQNILYFVSQVDERITLQDSRCDHLERLIRGLQEPADWDDWNLLFRLLNLLKLKISKLSITYKVPINETPITNEDLSQFGFILREIETKLNKLPQDQIVETGIKAEQIESILESLNTIQTLDPSAFDFYPLYPSIPEEE